MKLITTVSYIRSLHTENDKASFVVVLYDTLENPPMDKPVLELALEGCECLGQQEKELAAISEDILWGLEVTEIDEKYRLDFYDEYDLALSIYCARYDTNYRKFNEQEWADLVSSFERHVKHQHNEIHSLQVSISNIRTKLKQRIEKQQLAINQTDDDSSLKKRAISKLEIYSEVKNILENELQKNV